MTNKKRGGKRPNAGRPRIYKQSVSERTKVARIEIKHYERIKSGAYDELLSLLSEAKSDIHNNPKSSTSPRYQKLISLINEVDEILETNWHIL